MIALIQVRPETSSTELIAGKPLLIWQVESLVASGVAKIIVAFPRGREDVKACLGDGSAFHTSISYIEESRPVGTGGVMYYAAKFIKEDFLYLYDDLVLDIDFERLLKFHKKHHAIITAYASPVSNALEEDMLVVNSLDRVINVLEKGSPREIFYENLACKGVYAISRYLLDTFDGLTAPMKIDFEQELFLPTAIAEGAYAYRGAEYIQNVAKEKAKEDLASGLVASRNVRRKQKAIFLDRDGVLNVFGDYVVHPDMLKLKEDAASALRRINESGYLAICITNQPIVARGKVSESVLHEIHWKLQDMLGEQGAYLDDLFYCPHFPEKGEEGEVAELKIDCDCRKPKIGMPLAAAKKYNIDLSSSWFVGDTCQDVQTGINANCRTVMLTSGDPNPAKKYPDAKADLICEGLEEAVEYILSNS